MKLFGAAAVLCLAVGASAQVMINADVTFAPGVGSITTDGDTSFDPASWTYWTFYANAGDMIDWEVNRLVDEFDPVAAVVEGNLAGASFAGSIFDNPLMGLPVVSIGDDEEPPATGGGPFSDPHVVFMAPSTGCYTIAVSSYGSDLIPIGGYLHEVVVNGSTYVPAPGAAALFAAAGLIGFRRRR